MAIQESGEMYLETIYLLGRKSDSVRSVDIAEDMGFSKPSVSRAVHLLEKDEFLTVDKEGNIKLTEKGKHRAQKIYERHVILSKMLMKLGVDEETAAGDACRMEHIISDKSFAAIKQKLYEEIKNDL